MGFEVMPAESLVMMPLCRGPAPMQTREEMAVIPGQPRQPQSCGSRFAPKLGSQAQS
jgi:hypothetical protein